MVEYKRVVLSNGLKVLLHQDFSTPMAAVNVLYDVGSRDEHPDRTGFAHLFEHLMFGGSVNAPDFDDPIQSAGGENNAFTNTDITNFYELIPAENIETALWLESDRMLQLAFSQQALDTQKKVVIEEFKETCLNQPYGDMWHHLSAMAYTTHPYKWPTIGAKIDHIADASLDEVIHFFQTHYGPNNAVLVIAGPLTYDLSLSLAEKWFGDIPPIGLKPRLLPQEPPQVTPRTVELQSKVPAPAIYMGFKMSNRKHRDFYALDLLSDVLANGRSSRFYKILHKQKGLFSTIDAFISGTVDPGLFIIEGKPTDGVSIENAKSAIWEQLEELKCNPLNSNELDKLKNKTISSMVYSEVSVLNKAISLAYFESLGDAELINSEVQSYTEVISDDIQRVAQKLFTPERLNEIIYLPQGGTVESGSVVV